jgi:F-type H+-transporting ATPase subunit b
MQEVFSSLGITPPQIVSNILAFAVLVWLLRKFLFTPISNVLELRADRVKADRDEASRLRRVAAQQQSELERRLAGIESEARDRIQAAEREAATVREDLLAAARGERDRIIAAGHNELRREREKLLTELRDVVADLAMAAAAKVIERELDVKAHRAIIDDIVEHGVK